MGYTGDVEYIQPNEIGCMELSETEQKVISKCERNHIYRIISVAVSFAILMVGILMAKINMDSDGELGETAISYIFTGGMSFITGLFAKFKAKYTAAAYGTVVHKDIITQKVVSGKKYRYKKYIAEPNDYGKFTAEQDFYYLTVKLNSGKYVKYVNCLREDFINISVGHSILVVCYGFNEVKGYIT